ncbi:transposase [Streptomyces sp. P9-1]|uniref:transposase n=1 Tax=Streptomyces sp. P9-1 TaxID=3422589 RepID=UPI003D35C277
MDSTFCRAPSTQPRRSISPATATHDPWPLRVTAGQVGDAPAFETVIADIRVPRSGPGRPRTRPDVVLADRAYSSRAMREHLRQRGTRAVFPQPADQAGHRLRRGRAGGRAPGFDAEAYKQRNAVERCINRLEQWRGLAMRTASPTRPHCTSLRCSCEHGPD